MTSKIVVSWPETNLFDDVESFDRAHLWRSILVTEKEAAKVARRAGVEND